MVEVIESKKSREKGKSKWSAGLTLALLVLSVAVVIGWSSVGPRIGYLTRDGDHKHCTCPKVWSLCD
ncbi:hypothetical protein MLD38_016682 [Melastoma candidum]|uniref:Uncharacterized protein n=1 Tax=Melastoma candidum TaxID=119954 RepID=A0ACB9QNA2_9MYRT|nr:hypothetical protein MLD38_016682 [Melastoma candidum]